MTDIITIVAAIVTILLGAIEIYKYFWPDVPLFKRKINTIDKQDDYNVITKHVDMQYIVKTGLQQRWEKDGYNLRWTSPSKVSSRDLDGYQKMFILNEENKEMIFFDILRSDGSVELILMGKKQG